MVVCRARNNPIHAFSLSQVLRESVDLIRRTAHSPKDLPNRSTVLRGDSGIAKARDDQVIVAGFLPADQP